MNIKGRRYLVPLPASAGLTQEARRRQEEDTAGRLKGGGIVDTYISGFLMGF